MMSNVRVKIVDVLTDNNEIVEISDLTDLAICDLIYQAKTLLKELTDYRYTKYSR